MWRDLNNDAGGAMRAIRCWYVIEGPLIGRVYAVDADYDVDVPIPLPDGGVAIYRTDAVMPQDPPLRDPPFFDILSYVRTEAGG